MNRKLIFFYSQTCGKCHAIKRRIDRLILEGLFPIDYEIVDVIIDMKLAKKYKIEGTPTIILLENNKEVKRMKGSVYREDIIDFIR